MGFSSPELLRDCLNDFMGTNRIFAIRIYQGGVNHGRNDLNAFLFNCTSLIFALNNVMGYCGFDIEFKRIEIKTDC